MSQLKNISIIVLAAGGSSRLGTPKQLLPFKGKTLLEATISAARGVHAQDVIVMLGAGSEEVKKEIDETGIHVIVNADWRAGMASSITLGLKTAMHLNPFMTGVIFTVCDQPFVSSSLLSSLASEHLSEGSPIVACGYGHTIGTPAFFQYTFFPELLLLEGDEGAKKILKKYPDKLSILPFPDGEIDIDTPEDYERLKEND